MSVEIVSRRLPPLRGSAGRLLVAMLAVFLLVGLWFQGRPEFVAWQLARDHKRGLSQDRGGQVWSSEPSIVTDWLERHGTSLPPLPPRVGGAGLVGARYCALVDRVAAHVVYEGERTSVSLFVVTGPLRAPVAWAATLDGLHLGFIRSAGRTIAVIGESESDVRAALRSFTTTYASLEPAAPCEADGADRRLRQKGEANALRLAHARG